MKDANKIFARASKPTKHNKYYMYGKHAVLAAVGNPKRIVEKIYCLEKFFLEHQNKLEDSKVEIVTNDFINNKIGQNLPHQGIIAYVRTVFLKNLDHFNCINRIEHSIERIAILDQITDPQNIGAIIRSAAAFNINKIIMPADNTPDESASIAKAASGCLELVEIVKVTSLRRTIQQLKKAGFWLAGLALGGNDELGTLAKFDKLAIIIGAENKGMRRLTLESCDLIVRINISDKVQSLNAASAASIVFYSSHR